MIHHNPSRSEGSVATGAESNSSITIPIILMTAPPQHKQRYYYIFWSIATLSVVIGQICVVNTYNRLSDNLEYVIIEQAREKTAETAN